MLRRVLIILTVTSALALVASNAEEGRLEEVLKWLRSAKDKNEAFGYLILFAFGANETVLNGVANNDSVTIEFAKEIIEGAQKSVQAAGAFQVKVEHNRCPQYSRVLDIMTH